MIKFTKLYKKTLIMKHLKIIGCHQKFLNLANVIIFIESKVEIIKSKFIQRAYRF